MKTSRRRFLHAATASASASVLAAQSGPARPASANDRIQVAVIGMGIMGLGDTRTAVSVPGVELVAMADVYDGRRVRARELFGQHVFTTRDYREVLARPDVDAVIVATPDHWHARIAADAMAAGKDVYCQKPMVQKVEEGQAVIDAQSRTKRILQVGSQRVSSVLYAKARDLIKQGAIGQVTMVDASWDRNSSMGAWQYTLPLDATPETIDWERFLGNAPKRPFEPIRLFRWRNYQDYGTGVAGDLFVHQFSGIHFIMDSLGPNRVMASGGLHYWKDGRDVPDVMMGMYDYPATATHPAYHVNLRVNFVSGGGERSGFRFVGSEGVLDLAVGGALTLMKNPKRPEPGLMMESFSADMQRRVLAKYRETYPTRQATVESMAGVGEQRFTVPPGYTEQYAHHANFFDAVRSRRPVVEDAAFGLRAAGPALLSNVSYFDRTICGWDPVAMRRT